MMRKLRLKRVITLAVCFFLLASLSVSLVFADEKEVSNFDNFEKVQTYKEGTFTDVKVDDWFHDNIVNLYEMKLMIGMSDNLFDTENSLKVSETFALAARINAIYTQSLVPEQIEGKNWFEPYVNFIKEKGIANPDDYDLSSSITRRQFAEIFAKTLPEEAFNAINDVKEGMIPDVTGDMELNKAIYTLFRSGILTGMDETRTFEPERTIKRSEAATIVSRIVNPKLRIDLGLPIIEEPVTPVMPVDKKTSSGGGGSSSGGGGGGNTPAKDYLKDPLTFTVLSEGSTFITFCEEGTINDGVSYQYRLESGEWEDYVMGTPIEVVKTFSFRAKEKVEKLSYNADTYRYFSIDNDNDSSNTNSAKVEVSGNIMSLLDPDMNLKNLSSKDGDGNYNYSQAFEMLFSDCSAITDASQLLLPATELAEYCYSCMFVGCTNLEDAPELPATELVDGCYDCMFYGCTNLEDAPELPATKIADSCYDCMFYGCTSLEDAPELPATELADYCYDGMFNGCTNLVTAPELPATTLTDSCYSCMFAGCTNLVTAPELPATELADSCYFAMFKWCTNLEDAPELPATTLAYSCYKSMFDGCANLVTAPELPATTLADECYKSMFNVCTSLEDAPSLPATTLANSCYYLMFNECTSLEDAPELPATELADYCYDGMFHGCTNLVTAPSLPATTLAKSCYQSMFYKCTNLKNVTILSDDFNPSNSTTFWLYGVDGNNLTVTITKELNDKINEPGFSRSNSTIPTGATIKVLPEKGDLIYLDNNKDELYKVLNRDGVNLELITIQPVGVKEWTTTEVVKGVFSNLVNYPLYGSSLIDSWLNGDETDDYYHSLSDNIKNAIVQKEIVQKAYEVSDTEPASYTFSKDTTYFTLLGTVSLGLRNVYLPGLEDIINFFKDSETDNGITIGELKSLVGDNSWLRDHFSDQADTDYQDKKYNFASFTVDASKIDYELYDDNDDYFCITSIGDNQAKVKIVEYNYTGGIIPMPLEYSTDKENWTPFVYSTKDVTNTEITLNKDDKVYFRSTEPIYEFNYGEIDTDRWWYDSRTFVIDDDDNSTNTCNAKVEVSGNILSLLDPECRIIDLSRKKADGTDAYYKAFYKLFAECKAITSAENLKLPANRLGEECYSEMFYKCENLEKAPELPAEYLADFCYYGMFWNCIKLKVAPNLNSTNLAIGCYSNMFFYCSALDTVQDILPATELKMQCYQCLYQYCPALETAPELPAENLAKYCYDCMFEGCTNLKTMKIGFKEIPDENEVEDPFGDWLNGVPVSTLTIYVPTGFILPPDADRDECNIPMGVNIIGQ